MVHHCCVPRCSSNSRTSEGISFHCFPSEKKESLRKEWILKVKRDTGKDFSVNSETRVCSLHFVPEDYYPTAGEISRKKLKPNSVPSVFRWLQKTLTVSRRTMPTKVQQVQVSTVTLEEPPSTSSFQSEIQRRPSKLYDTANPDWAPSVKMGYDFDIGLATTESKLNGQCILADVQAIDDDLDNQHPISEEYCENDGNVNGDKTAEEILPEEALTQEQACEKVWTDLFEKSSFQSFEDFFSIFTQYQDETFSAYRIFDCNRVETANFKRKSKLNPSLKYSSVTFYCALFGQQKPRGKNLLIQNYRSQSCPSFLKLTSSSRDQQLRVLEKNLLHNHKLEKSQYECFNQCRKFPQEKPKDDVLDALSSVEVIIKDETGSSGSPPGNELSNGDKQNLCSDLTGGMSTTLIQMETMHFRKWMTILEDLLLKMELDANSEANFATPHKKSKTNSVPQNKRRMEKLETCDTDKEVCNACKMHEPPKRVCPTRVIEWIDCDSCAKWYHRACLPAIMDTKHYKCTGCGPPS